MVALLDRLTSGHLPGVAALVMSDNPLAAGLEVARKRDIPVKVIGWKGKTLRDHHDRRMLEALQEAKIDLVCLAGYMRIITPAFVEAYRNRILNIHPSLLPAFPGLHGPRQALDKGVKVSGCTVHLVDEQMDHGPILAQAAVPVLPGDSEDDLAQRILLREHLLYPEVLGWMLRDQVRVDGEKAVIENENTLREKLNDKLDQIRDSQ